MNTELINSSTIDYEVVYNYLKHLVNQFFKILPMKENSEDTLHTYMKSLQMEIIGCKNVIMAFNNDPSFLSLISILQYLIDFPECEVTEVRREVFKAISVCNRLKSVYAERGC